ncbi:cytochrome b [Anthocerotibacter panamensis]|uniref:cytochrome b n=1 Tax=Anthocerotibacter panamensis TaxID=2857077 RepID=UPI001C407F2A|nr:cytochrome b/b6 domain-containing protein [Anthocerotibacter panamensis]
MALSKVQASRALWWMHWVMATCFLIIFSVGIYMADLPREVPYRLALFGFHKSMGMLVLILLSIRIFLLLRSALPARWPKRPAQWLKTVLLHTFLYTFMLALPVSGYYYSNIVGRGVKLFGLPIPSLIPENKALGELASNLHFWLAYTFLAFIATHLLVQNRFLVTRWRKLFSPKPSAS